MDSLTFTIKLKDLNDPEQPEEAIEDIKTIITLLQRANPNYYLIGNMLDEQLNKQLKETDPRERFRKKLDKMCPYMMEAMQDAELKDRYTLLKTQIGEAMGPVYAAHHLAHTLRKRDLCNDWVWDFVKYYEDNWEF